MTNGKTICTVCNYIYDESLGEPTQDIPPAVGFDALPEEWQCPDCNSSKIMFQPCSCVSLSIYEQTCVPHGQTTLKNALSGKSVGQIVSEQPDWACVLEQFGIDYCCGGKKTLQQACEQTGANIDTVVQQLVQREAKSGASGEPDWTKTSLKELIEHIVVSYHQPLRAELLRIALMAEKVARVHGTKHPEMIELFEVFTTFSEQLDVHMQKEELILFPGIASLESGGTPKSFGCGGGIEHPVEIMTREHEDAGEALSTMRRLSSNYTPPEDACNTFKILLHSLAKLELEMHEHVHKENNILFPRALALPSLATIRK